MNCTFHNSWYATDLRRTEQQEHRKALTRYRITQDQLLRALDAARDAPHDLGMRRAIRTLITLRQREWHNVLIWQPLPTGH